MQDDAKRQKLMMPKNFSASQINWIGMLTLAISILGFVQGQELIAQYPSVVAGIGAAIAVLMMVVRLFDQQPVRLPFMSKKIDDVY